MFHEAEPGSVPIRDLKLSIAGTVLEPILTDFEGELSRAKIHRLQPHFYLSTEWGVPFGTISIAIPFYLAHPELTQYHAEHQGFVEGTNHADILRYLRHEMGHVVNYAYRLYDQEEWVKRFGSITQPYLEEYRPQPFSRRYVYHLPGWYAQKHPDEDWAETFAVWMTPGRDWGTEYAGWPEALAKLEFCDRTLQDCRDRDPLITVVDRDEDVADLHYSLEHYYGSIPTSVIEFPPGLDGALHTIFEAADSNESSSISRPGRRKASELILRSGRELAANIYRWTGHFPERTQLLLNHLARRADQSDLVYAEDQEKATSVALTTFLTALAMNYVYRGSYLP